MGDETELIVSVPAGDERWYVNNFGVGSLVELHGEGAKRPGIYETVRLTKRDDGCYVAVVVPAEPKRHRAFKAGR